jgi:Cof subfamily protein (haloacid dehalogenase superfamily)
MKADAVISLSFIDLETANAVFDALTPFCPEYHIYLQDGLLIEDKKNMTTFFERVYEVASGDKSVYDAVNALYAFAKRVPNARAAVNDNAQKAAITSNSNQGGRNSPIQKICCCVPERQIGNAMSALSILSGIEVVAINKNDIEITLAGATKGQALQQLCELLRIDKSNVMAFGDSGNDLSMRDSAGFFVAMGNASPEVKAVADYVAASVDDDGVARALGELL